MARVNFLKRVLVLPVVMLATLLGGCAAFDGGSVPQHESAGDPYPQNGDQNHPAEVPAEDGQDTDVGAEEPMVIRTKTIRLEVDSTSEAIGQVRELTGSVSGTVSEMRVATDDGYVRRDDGGDGSAMRGWITVRVPTDSYEAFIVDAMELGEVLYQSETAEDVTQQHVDLTARLENLRAQEERLREFFDAATDVEEMLAIEQELGRVRGEIESLDAQIKYLERQAAMATVTVELTEPEDIVTPQGPSWGFVEAITDGFRGAAGILTGIITLVIATAPLWVAGLVLFFPIRALVRRRRARAAKEGRLPRASILTTVPAATRPTAAHAPASPKDETSVPTPASGATPPSAG